MEEGLDLEEIAIMEETNQVLGLERITTVEVILEEDLALERIIMVETREDLASEETIMVIV